MRGSFRLQHNSRKSTGREAPVSKRTTSALPKQKGSFGTYMKRYWQLYALLALPLIYLFVFKYVPMVYVLIAFKKYNITKGVFEMEWAKENGMQ